MNDLEIVLLEIDIAILKTERRLICLNSPIDVNQLNEIDRNIEEKELKAKERKKKIDDLLSDI